MNALGLLDSEAVDQNLCQNRSKLTDMTNQSIRIPEGWTAGPVHGRYEDTRFTFRYAESDETDLVVQLIGAPSDRYEAEYNLQVALGEPTDTSNRTDNRAATFYSEAAAM